MINLIQSIVDVIFVAILIRYLVMFRNLERRIDDTWERRERLYDSLADPIRIEEEMEKGARLREMHDANRTTLPRDDAVGQHARVFRPKMRSKFNTPWNPPRV